jgi:hypothetical protein
MLRQPAPQPLCYQDHIVQINRLVDVVLRRHNRIGSCHWDGGTVNTLADWADHTLMIRSGPGDVIVTSRAHWFRDPSSHRYAIDAAAEEALAA